MELRVLEYFLAVAREETISSAAEYLHITQPTLSRQLKDLEDELGKQLFIRGNRKIELTEEGLILRRRAEEIIGLVDKTQAKIINNDEAVSGDIYLGSDETYAFKIIAKVIAKMHEDYPNVRFHLYSGNGDDIKDKIDKGLLDFGVVIEPTSLTKYDFIKLPATDKWGVLMTKSSPLASYDTITPDLLSKAPLYISNQETVKNEMTGWLGGQGRELNIIDTYNLIYNVSLLIQETNNYALCIEHLVYTGIDSPFVFKPLSPTLEVNLDLIWKKYPVFTKASEKFLEYLKREIDA